MRSTFSTLASTDVSSASSSSAGPPRLSDNDLVLREEAPRQAPTRRRRKARRKIVGQRRKRADQVRTIFAVPDLLRSCDNLQVECLGFSEDPFSVVGFRRSDMWERFEQEDRTDNVVVAVEVSCMLVEVSQQESLIDTFSSRCRPPPFVDLMWKCAVGPLLTICGSPSCWGATLLLSLIHI